MNATGKITLNMKPVRRILAYKGLTAGGDVQRFYTANVLRRIVRYMPYRTGATIKLTVAQTDIGRPQIVTNVPYCKYLYYGKAMEGGPPKRVTDRDLNYTKTKNPRAGPFWDRAMMAAEGAALAADLQRYIKSKR